MIVTSRKIQMQRRPQHTEAYDYKKPTPANPRVPARPQAPSATPAQPQAPPATSLTEFTRSNRLPSIVRIVKGRFGDIGSGPVDADAEIYVHSSRISPSGTKTPDKKTTSTVQAQVMSYEPESNAVVMPSPGKPWRAGRYATRTTPSSPASGPRRLVVTGRTVCLPVDGPEVVGCWFELLSEDGRGATPIGSVEELVNHAFRGSPVRRTKRYLVRQTVFGSVGSTSSSVSVQPGEVLRPVRLIRYAPQGANDTLHPDGDPRRPRKDAVTVLCLDRRNGSVFLPLDQVGQFSPVSDDNDAINDNEFPETPSSGGFGIVYDSIGAIVTSYRLPVTVRVVAGRMSIPDSVGLPSRSMIFRLTALSKIIEKTDDVKPIPASASLLKPPLEKQLEIDVISGDETVYVMALRDAWSPSGIDVNGDASLIAVPPEAARSLFVVAVSQDFRDSWLETVEGRHLATRCDRIIADRRKQLADTPTRSNRQRSSSRGPIDDEDANQLRTGLRRPMSADSGLASSGLTNDDLYDEIDDIYCMIRYGAGGYPMALSKLQPALQRAKSYEDGGEKKPVKSLVWDGGRQSVDRGLTAVNARTCPDFRQHQTVSESSFGQLSRHQNGRTTPAFDHQSRDHHRHVIARPQLSHGLAGDGRSQVSRKSLSSVTHAMDERMAPESDANRKLQDESKFLGFSPITMTSCRPLNNEQTDTDRDSTGISVDMTTIGATKNREIVGVIDTSSSVANRVDTDATSGYLKSPTVNVRSRQRRPKSTSADDQQRLRHQPGITVSGPNRIAHAKSVSNILDAYDVTGIGETRRKQSTIVGSISQTLSSAFRRVGKRVKNKNSKFDVADNERQLDSKLNDVTAEVQGVGLRLQRKSSSEQKDQRSPKTTWYFDDEEDEDNNNLVDESEMFNSDIGDGRLNRNFQRGGYETTRSHQSWTQLIAVTVPEVNETRGSLRWHQKEPPLLIASGRRDEILVATTGRGRQSTKHVRPHVADLFTGNRSDDVVGYAGGHYVHIGQY